MSFLLLRTNHRLDLSASIEPQKLRRGTTCNHGEHKEHGGDAFIYGNLVFLISLFFVFFVFFVFSTSVPDLSIYLPHPWGR